MDISKSVARACESGRELAAHLVDALDLLIDRIDLGLKAFEMAVICVLVKGCSKAATALTDRARYIVDCVEEDERSRYGNCRR